MYSGGTPEAMAFLKKYKKSRHVVDFYSDEYIKKIDPDESSITIEKLKSFDIDHGTSYRGHMIAIYIGDQNQMMIEELSKIYLPIKRILTLKGLFETWAYKPSLLLVNLATKEILCVGLGKLNRIFYFELHKYLEYQTTNNEANKALFNPSNVSTDCSPEFFQLDFYNIAKTTLKEVEHIGKLYYGYLHLDGNAEVWVTLNEDDGLYYFDDFNLDGMTLEEVNELKMQYENYQEWIQDCTSELKIFFPKMTDWDLSSGDY